MSRLDRRLLGRTKAVRRLLVLDVTLGIASAVLIVVQAVLLARVVAGSFDGAPPGSMSVDIAVLAVTFGIRGILGWGAEVAGRHAASTVMSELRSALTARRLRTQPSAADGVQSGEIAAATVQGVDGLEAYFGRYLPQLVLSCAVPPIILVWVATIDLVSAAIMLLTLPLVPVFMWLIGRYTEQRTVERWQALRLLSVHFLDVVQGLPALRAYNRTDIAGEIESVGERYRRATMSTLRISFLSGSVLELAATLGVALVAVTAGVRLVGGGLGFQAALTVLVLAPELYIPLRSVGVQFHASADGLAVADRLLALVEQPPALRGRGTRTPPSPADAPVRMEHVSFGYPSRDVLVLDGFDLELFPGETVALVGRSGAGKSTVASLLLRFSDPVAGQITVGPVDIEHCWPGAWREFIAWVPQRPTIFRGSVAENIRIGNPSASDREVRRAAGRAAADEFIEGLAEGYSTLVGDGGRDLSAGERRRIGLARAFLRTAPLVILDEPTADLDPVNAILVGDAVTRLRQGSTVLLIGHRPELIRQADRCVLLENGRAVILPRSAVA